jgi:hypothetical protein
VERFCIAASKNAAFVYAMEDVLDVYHRPYDPRLPQVCLDETSKQLLEHVRVPIAPAPGLPRRVDDEYRRCGTANVFLAIEPLKGRVITEATERRTSIDFAHFLRRVSDVEYPEAERIVLVMDNLSTHSLASLYEAFEPDAARRLAERFRDSLHAQARQLAQHCRDWALSSGRTSTRPAHRFARKASLRACRLARPTHLCPGPLALQHRRRPHQTAPPLS